MKRAKSRVHSYGQKGLKRITAGSCCGWILFGIIACGDGSTTPADPGVNANPVDAGSQTSPIQTTPRADSTARVTGGSGADSAVSIGSDGTTATSKPQTDASTIPASRDATTPATDTQDPARDASEPARDAATTNETTPPVEQTCPASATGLRAGNSSGTVMHAGQNRNYLIHVPEGIDSAKPVPMVLDFHGYSRTPASEQRGSGWDVVADREKFLVVYPEGIGLSWNVDDTCCGTAGSQVIDDVGLTKALIEHLAEQACIDRRRIYATGISNGGGLAHRLGCDAADIIAAVAPVSTDLRTQPCTPSRPISVMAFRGMTDALEPYEGGLVGPIGGQYNSPGAKGSLELWRNIDQCTGTPTTVDEYCESYTECADGVEADLCSLPNVGHAPYVNGLGFSVVETAWKMFARQPMK